MLIFYYYNDDIFGIDSTMCRLQSEVILAQKVIIASLSDAVSRLACTIQSKEEEIRIRDRSESDYERKNLDLLIEIAELKHQVAELKDELSSNLEQQSAFVCKKDNRCDESYEPFEFLNDEDNENKKEHYNLHDRILSPPNIIRKYMPMENVSNLDVNLDINLKPRVRHPPSIDCLHSTFGTAQSRLIPNGHAFVWDWDEDECPTPNIPKQIFFPAELKLSPISDEVSDISHSS